MGFVVCWFEYVMVLVMYVVWFENLVYLCMFEELGKFVVSLVMYVLFYVVVE